MKDSADQFNPSGDFSQTHWTTVLHAQGTSSSAHEALNKLCRRYWPPVYAFIRRKWTQHPPHKAEDLTQGFFVEFIRKFPDLEIGSHKGKFRTYLLACLTHYLCKDWERSSPSGELLIPPDELEKAVRDDVMVTSTHDTPERAFDMVWANTLVEKALASLREEYDKTGKTSLHTLLLPQLASRTADGRCAEIAGELEMSEGALRVATHQFRRRFGQLLRAQVAHTVPRPEDTDDELRYLLSLWSPSVPSAEISS